MLQKEDRLSFCINLEVVNLQDRNPTFVFWEKLWLDNLVSRLTDLYHLWQSLKDITVKAESSEGYVRIQFLAFVLHDFYTSDAY